MITGSGIATFSIRGLGYFRLDDTALRLIVPEDQDPALYPKLESLVQSTFDFIDGRHVTVREAVAKLPAALHISPDDITHLAIVDEQTVQPPPDDGVH